MAKPSFPKKGLGSYLLPFLLIIVLLGTGVYILQNNINLDDLKRVLKAPEVTKEEKVTIVFAEGEPELKTWSEQEWTSLTDEIYLQAGDTLRTGTGEMLVLRFFEGSEVRLAPESTLKLIQMDRDPVAGNQIALELERGQLWRRGVKGNTPDADFIIRTSFHILQMNEEVLLDLETNPDTVRVIAGSVMDNISEQSNGTRKPITRMELKGGQELVLDTLTIDQLKAGDKDVLTGLSDNYLSSEWYLWNLDKEERLGMLLDPELEAAEEQELDALESGLVTIESPEDGERTGANVRVTGSYDPEMIDGIWVNGQEAIFGFEGDWEANITVSSDRSTLRVTAQEADSGQEKLVEDRQLDVDDQGPGLGAVQQPSVDDNNNGVLDSDELELIGEVSSEAESVCIEHNDSGSPYCLQQFTPGDDTYRYLGSVAYGNVVEGRNKYEIIASDDLGNVSRKVIYLFKGVEKPDEPIEPTDTADEQSPSSDAPAPPVITDPGADGPIETAESPLNISGTVGGEVVSLLVNEKKAPFESGSGAFSVDVDLVEGENLIKLKALNSQGKESPTTLLRILYFEEKIEEPDL